MFDWSEENIAWLRRLWETKASAGQIAKKMGVSRNSIIGKSARLDLPKRTGLTHLPRNRSSYTPKPTPSEVKMPPIGPPVSTEGVCLYDHKEGQCRDIIGSNANLYGFQIAQYCGQPTTDDRSFCPYHYGRYHLPPVRR